MQALPPSSTTYPLRPIGAWLAAVALAAGLLPCDSVHGAQTHDIEADADPVATHLERGLAYLEQGEQAKALLEFEQVLRFDNLPADLSQRAEIYARAARGYREGKRLSGFGFAETGGGYYRENVTRTTNALGGDPARDWFWEARVGGGLAYVLGDDLTIDGSLDYQFRHYDDSHRYNDSDLRWNGAVIQSLDEGSQSIGVRGEASYRGEDGYRQDYGLFANRYFTLDPDNQISLEGEIRTRRYPSGEERQYSRDIGEIWLGWTRALANGKASLTITLNGGREWATQDRPAGDQTFYGVAFDWGMDLDERLGVFMAGLWEHNGYHEDVAVDDESDEARELSPDLDIYEIGGGLTYEFAPGWSLRPEVLYIRDEGDTRYSDYSATEFWLIVRASF
jgi:tetratricopeptide (TPR) repeat protein